VHIVFYDLDFSNLDTLRKFSQQLVLALVKWMEWLQNAARIKVRWCCAYHLVCLFYDLGNSCTIV